MTEESSRTSHVPHASPASPASRPQRPPVRLGAPTPYLRVKDAARAIGFYVDAFGATEIVRLVEPNGRVAHAELLFGSCIASNNSADAATSGTTVMLSDEYPEYGLRGPEALGGTPVAVIMYVADVDDVCARVVRFGGTVRSAPRLDPFGDRTAKIVDPCGHEWMIATRVDVVSPAEMQERFATLMNGAKR